MLKKLVLSFLLTFQIFYSLNAFAIFKAGNQSLINNGVSIALGDLDNDGDIDAFLANEDSDIILLNNSNVEFSQSNIQFPNRFSYSVDLGDIDNDGDLDAVLTVDENSPHVVFYINDGMANFNELTPSIPASGKAYLVDVNADDSVDLIVESSNRYHIWLNNGSGEFGDSGTFLESARGSDIAFGDLNNDGTIDVFIANRGHIEDTNKYDTVWLNDGTGSFSQTNQQIGENRDSTAISLGDLDNDGDLDAYISDYSSGSLWVNDGSGNFSPHIVQLTNLFDSGSTTGKFIDIDNDGDLDLLDGAINGANVIWLNDGNGNFTSGQVFSSNQAIDSQIHDLNGDGFREFILVELNTVSIWMNNSSGHVAALQQNFPPTVTIDLDKGDIDRDGDTDVVEVSNTQVLAWLNNGRGEFALKELYVFSTGEWLRSVGLFDVDNDSDLDIFVSNSTGANRILLNEGNGNYVLGNQLLGNSESEDANFGDFDNDGDVDIFVANLSQPNIVWLNDGSGQFHDNGQQLGSGYSIDVEVGDIDNDSDLDVFVGGVNILWLNDSNGNFVRSEPHIGFYNTKTAALADFDSDGDLDLFLGAWLIDGGRNRLYYNTGNGRFINSGLAIDDISIFSSAVADINKDGYLDVLTGTVGPDDTMVWLNNKNGILVDSGERIGIPDVEYDVIMLDDFDSDGDIDAFLGNWGSSNSFWINEYENQQSSPAINNTGGGALLWLVLFLFYWKALLICRTKRDISRF